jgi:hypothetical protein
MAEMRFAARTNYFGTFHAMRIIGTVNNAVFPDRLKKTGPAAAACKFSIRFKEHIAAHRAIIGSPCAAVPQFPRKGRFCILLAGYGI